MTLRFFPFLLLAVPLAEIACFIVVGQYIGVLPTIGLVVLTTIIGSVLLRIQGFSILQKLTRESQEGKNPGKDLVQGAMIAVAGLLLIVPGFITDILGFLLFIPAVRERVWNFMRSRMTIVSSASRFTGSYGEPYAQRRSEVDAKIVDLEEDEFKRDPDPKSPWNAP
jgi:UPF0716 protein FxsA